MGSGWFGEARAAVFCSELSRSLMLKWCGCFAMPFAYLLGFERRELGRLYSASMQRGPLELKLGLSLVVHGSIFLLAYFYASTTQVHFYRSREDPKRKILPLFVSGLRYFNVHFLASTPLFWPCSLP